MTVVMDLKFDTIAKALNWASVLNHNPGTPGLPKFVTAALAADRYIEFDFAPRGAVIPPVTVSFAVKTNYSGIFAASQVMDGNTSHPVGTRAYCLDPDPAKRGEYIHAGGGVWTFVTATITDIAWRDPNHKERLLELIATSWIASVPLHPGAGSNQGWVSPPANDWRTATITIDCQAVDLWLGPWGKIALHLQGDVPRLTWGLPKRLDFSAQPLADSTISINGTVFTFKAAGAAGNQVNIGADLAATLANLATVLNASAVAGVALATYTASATRLEALTKSPTYPGTPFTVNATADAAGVNSNARLTGCFATPNFIFTKTLISDQLGFGTDSWGTTNKVPRIANSGRRQIVLQLTTDDKDWDCLGSVDRPDGFYVYVAGVPVLELLTNLIGNMFIMAVHDKPQADDAHFTPVARGIDEKDRIAGKLRLFGIKVEVTP